MPLDMTKKTLHIASSRIQHPLLHSCARLDPARIELSESISNSGLDLVYILLPEIASVDGIARIPRASVEAAIGTLRHIVLGKDVRSEEVARLVGAIGSNKVLLVEGGLGLASSGADGRIKGTLIVKLHAVVGVVAVVERSVDGCGE